MKTCRIATIIIFVITISLHSLFAQTNEVADPDPLRFKNEIAAFVEWDKKNSFPNNAVLFTGSSSIRLWHSAEAFPETPAINRGFGGAHISDVLYFYDTIVRKYTPAVIVFYTGDNDIAGKKPAPQVYEDYLEFIRRVQTDFTGVKLIYIPIKPSTSRWHLWQPMNEVNTLIEKYNATDDDLFYADTATPMLDSDGKPREELLAADGLHLSPAGYDLWKSIVKPIIDDLYKK